jgi:hypothetical protein
MLRDSTSFTMKSEIEILDEIQSITEDCIMSMRLKIKDYNLINNTKLLNILFDECKSKIKDTVDEAIKNFIKLSKTQQTKIIELTNKRTEQITKRINDLIDSKDSKEKKEED